MGVYFDGTSSGHGANGKRQKESSPLQHGCLVRTLHSPSQPFRSPRPGILCVAAQTLSWESIASGRNTSNATVSHTKPREVRTERSTHSRLCGDGDSMQPPCASGFLSRKQNHQEYQEAGEGAQGLRMLAALAEDQSSLREDQCSILSTCMVTRL